MAKKALIAMSGGVDSSVTAARMVEAGYTCLGATMRLHGYGACCSADDARDALDVFGQYVRNLHAKDGRYPVNGHDLGQETRLGEGKVDFYALFKKLKELGYDAHVTIEREIAGDQQLKDVLDARAYLRTVIGEVYGGDAVC